MELKQREEAARRRLEQVEALEQEIRHREQALKAKEREKKQVLLRLSPSLWGEIAAWAEDEFRSINGQIEFLLSQAVKARRKR